MIDSLDQELDAMAEAILRAEIQPTRRWPARVTWCLRFALGCAIGATHVALSCGLGYFVLPRILDAEPSVAKPEHLVPTQYYVTGSGDVSLSSMQYWCGLTEPDELPCQCWNDE